MIVAGMLSVNPSAPPVPNAGHAIINGTSGTSTLTTRKYQFSNNTVGAGGSLLASLQSGATASNNEVGYFACGTINGGGRTNRSQRYVFATDVATEGGTLHAVASGVNALSSPTQALFSNGTTGSTWNTNRAWVTYATGAISTGSGGLSPGRSGAAGAGNSTFGWLMGGSTSTSGSTGVATVNSLTYATVAWAVATGLSANVYDAYGMSNGTNAYALTGRRGTTTLATGTVRVFATAAMRTVNMLASLPTPATGGACSNKAQGIFCGNGATTGYLFNFTTEVNVASAALGITTQTAMAISSEPGSF